MGYDYYSLRNGIGLFLQSIYYFKDEILEYKFVFYFIHFEKIRFIRNCV